MRSTALTRVCADLENRAMGYVLAIARSHPVSTGTGPLRVDRLAAMLPRAAWQRYSAGPGAKGHRYYDWAWVSIAPGTAGHRWLLIRRHLRTGELAFYRCYSPRPVPLAALVAVAGLRWTVEMVFPQLAKGPVRSVGGGWQHIADLDVAAVDDHAVDEQFG
jgi:hypothetical protein